MSANELLEALEEAKAQATETDGEWLSIRQIMKVKGWSRYMVEKHINTLDDEGILEYRRIPRQGRWGISAIPVYRSKAQTDTPL